MKKAFFAAAASLVCLVMLTPIAAQQPDSRSSSSRFHRKGDRAIQNHYIVVLDRDSTGRNGDVVANAMETASIMPEWAGTVTYRFNYAINGFAALMTEEQALSVSDDPRVAFVEEDSVVEALITQNNTGVRRTHTQFGGRAFIGFDAIGQRSIRRPFRRRSHPTASIGLPQNHIHAQHRIQLGQGVRPADSTTITPSLAASLTAA